MSRRTKRGPAAILDNAWLLGAAVTAVGVSSYYTWQWLQQEVDPRPATTTTQISSANGTTHRRRKVSIYTNDLIFDISRSSVSFTDNGRAILQSCIDRFELYIITKAPSEDLRRQILNLIEPLLPSLPSGQVDDRRVLFCESDEGRIHIVRHIASEYHIDASHDEASIAKMQTFVGRIISIGGAKSNNNVEAIADLSNWKLLVQ